VSLNLFLLALLSCDHCDQVFVVPEGELMCVTDTGLQAWVQDVCGPPDAGPLFCEPASVCQFPDYTEEGGCIYCVDEQIIKDWVDENCKNSCRVVKHVERNGTVTGGGVTLKCR
jgi:hypothetical protein